MDDKAKTKAEMIRELARLRQQVAELEEVETQRQQAEAALKDSLQEVEIAYDQALLIAKDLSSEINERKRIEAEIKQRNHQLLSLQRATTVITSSLDLAYVLETTAKEMVHLLEIEGCAISEWDLAGDRLMTLAEYAPADWEQRSLGSSFCLADYPCTKQVLVEGQVQQMTLSQAAAPAEQAYMQAAQLKTLLMVPLESQRRMIGLVEIEDSRVERTFTDQEIGLVQLLATQAASAIENAWLYKQAEQEIRERQRIEETLRHQEGLLRQILDTNPSIIFVKDDQATIILANQALADSYQMTVTEIVGRSHRDVQTEVGTNLETLEWWLADDQEVMATGQSQTIVEPYVHRDGSIHCNHTRKFPLELANGSRGVLVISEDITGQKQAEAALQESEARYRTLVETSPDAIVLMDLEGTILVCNQKTASLLGVRHVTEILGKSISQLIAPEDLPLVLNHRQRILEVGYLNNLEYTLIQPNGSTVPVELNTSVLVDQGGQRTGFISVIRDITERKQAEDRLHLLESVVITGRDAVLITEAGLLDAPGPAILYANAAFTHMTGYALEEILGHSPRILQGSNTDRNELNRIKTALMQREPVQVELINYRKDGSEYWVELNIVPLADTKGNITHFISVQREITERRQLEEQLHQSQKMEAIGRLAGGIAHDFNNLLVVITGYSDLLLQRYPQVDPSWHKDLEQIKRAGERAADLTRQLLAFSRRQMIRLEIVNLNEIVRGTEKMLRRLIGEDIELNSVLDPSLDLLKADRGQIEQILVNLVVNARDAMPQGGKLTLETANVELDQTYAQYHLAVKPGAYVMLAVSDTGVGMNAETQAHIFEPFFTTKEVGKGTGLGLATVYGIVNQNGGTVWVYSELGQGTTFKIYLPRLTEPVPVIKTEEVYPTAPPGVETILLVEDEAAVRKLTRKVLTEQGYTVLEANNGSDAIRLSEHYPGPIHLLLTDVVMPRMSGRELVECLRPLRPQMKILYMSGYTDDAIIRRGVLEPGADLLQKPFSPGSLARKVRELLDRH